MFAMLNQRRVLSGMPKTASIGRVGEKKSYMKNLHFLLYFTLFISIFSCNNSEPAAKQSETIPISGTYKAGKISYKLYEDHSFGKDFEVYGATGHEGGEWAGDANSMILNFRNGDKLNAFVSKGNLTIKGDPDMNENYSRQ